MNIMIDLETLDVKPGAVIISIAACTFNPATTYTNIDDFKDERKMAFNIDVNQSLKKGYTISEDTLSFWFNQKHDPLNTFTIKFYPSELLSELSHFIEELEVPEEYLNLWSNGILFDAGLLEHAYRKEGVPIPWRYDAWRDARTLFRLMGHNSLGIPFFGDKHNPMHDCYNQIANLVPLLRKLESL